MAEEVKQAKKEKYEEWEIKNAVDTLIKAEEIKNNKELMKLVEPELKKQAKAVNDAAEVLYGNK